jgi:dienelactone hydrolase
MLEEILLYQFDGVNFKHKLFFEKKTGKHPVVLIVPTWMGMNAFALEKGREMAALGYLTCVVDMFGEGVEAQDQEEAKNQVIPLLEDRQLIRERLQKLLEEIASDPRADRFNIAAIGFCFGGSCVLELAKSGQDIRGVACIHGLLGNPYKLSMRPVSTADYIPASILVLHGYKDALSSEQDLLNFEKEMDEKKADWQMIIYGTAMHGFTNPQLHMPHYSLQYDEKSSKRAFLATKQFLAEILKKRETITL